MIIALIRVSRPVTKGSTRGGGDERRTGERKNDAMPKTLGRQANS